MQTLKHESGILASEKALDVERALWGFLCGGLGGEGQSEAENPGR